jgi:hypothetical protein
MRISHPPRIRTPAANFRRYRLADPTKSAVLMLLLLPGVGQSADRTTVGPAAPGAIIQRTIMPDAGPSSFAVSFPEGVSLCFDPVRLGINYAWLGTVDLDPA